MNYDQWKLMSDRDGYEQQYIDEDLSPADKFANYVYENDDELDERVLEYIEYLESKIIRLEDDTKRNKKD
ncbi:MAG: hypothetical protein Unbinned92contig1003_36 [Prokaryotic dsDNA virus sp.]|nr:MAG: hypothetical protein Unbinned92contig1003_36 [Prokaryotic dsDNA virus sp.]